MSDADRRMRRVVAANGEHSPCAGISSSHLKKMYDQMSYDAILDAIRRGNITNGDISKATGISLEKCGKLLRQMRDEGILLSLTRGKFTIRPNYWK